MKTLKVIVKDEPYIGSADDRYAHLISSIRRNYCPNCKRQIIETMIDGKIQPINYCYHCGQKLKWND